MEILTEISTYSNTVRAISIAMTMPIIEVIHEADFWSDF